MLLQFHRHCLKIRRQSGKQVNSGSSLVRELVLGPVSSATILTTMKSHALPMLQAGPRREKNSLPAHQVASNHLLKALKRQSRRQNQPLSPSYRAAQLANHLSPPPASCLAPPVAPLPKRLVIHLVLSLEPQVVKKTEYISLAISDKNKLKPERLANNNIVPSIYEIQYKNIMALKLNVPWTEDTKPFIYKKEKNGQAVKYDAFVKVRCCKGKCPALNEPCTFVGAGTNNFKTHWNSIHAGKIYSTDRY